MKVVIVVAEQVSLFELASAVELFALPRPEFDNWYTTEEYNKSTGTDQVDPTR